MRVRYVWEKPYVVLSLLLLSGGAVPILRGGATDGDPLLAAMYFFIYMVALALILTEPRLVGRAAAKEVFLAAIVVVALASVFWSDNPYVSFRASLAFGGTVLFGLYIALQFSFKEQLRLVAWSVLCAGVMSVLFLASLPDLGNSENGVRGIYTTKNELGRFMCLGVLVSTILLNASSRRNLLALVTLGVSLALVGLSTSLTAIAVLIASLLLVLTISTFRRHLSQTVPVILLIISGLGYLAIVLARSNGVIFDVVNRDATLTGRTDIWNAVASMVQRRPWTGYGYSAFWDGLGSPASYVWYTVGWQPPNAHNGFLDVLVELGAIGLIIFSMGFVLAWARSIRLAIGPGLGTAIWPFIYLNYTLLYNLTESTLLRRNSIFPVLYVVVVFSLAAHQWNKSPGRTPDEPSKGTAVRIRHPLT